MLQQIINSDYSWGQYTTLNNLNISNGTLVGIAGSSSFPSSMSAWSNRVAITVDNTKVDADLTDFPVYVNLANLPSTFFDIVLSDGTDIKVTTSDGETNCPRELVAIDTAARTGELWFKAPTLNNATDTVFYIYYGKAAGGESNSTATWVSSYKMVQHMKDATTSTITDSTSNANNGTKTAAGGPAVADAKIGKGQTFDGTDDKITVADADSLDITTAFAMSAWVYVTDTSNRLNTIFDKTELTGANNQYFLTYDTRTGTDEVKFQHGAAGGGTNSVAWGTPGLLNTWFLLHAVYDGTNIKIYGNGTQRATAAYNGSPAANTKALLLGGFSTFFFKGTIDEMRVYVGTGGPVAATWISTEYNNQNSPSTFYSVGAQESATGPGFGTYISGNFPPRSGWTQMGWNASSGTYAIKTSILDANNNYIAGYSGLTAATINLSGLGMGSAYRVQFQISGISTTNVGSYYIGYPGQVQATIGTNNVILDGLKSVRTKAGGKKDTGFFQVVLNDPNTTVFTTYKKSDEVIINASSSESMTQVKIFDGQVDNLTHDSAKRETTITGKGFAMAMQNKPVNKTYTSIEVGSIVREVVSNIGTIGSANISGTSTTPTSWACNDEDAWSVVQKLADHVGYTFFVDVNKNGYFQPDTYTKSNTTAKAVYGNNLTRMEKQFIGQDIVNFVNVYGQTEIVSGIKTFTGDGSTKSFQLTDVPRSPLTKVQTPSGTTKTEFTDYDVNYQAGTLLFGTAPLNGSPVYVDYKTNRQVFATATDAASVDTYGEIKKKIYNDSLVTGSDCQTYANAWIAARSGADTVYSVTANKCETAQPRDSILVYNPRFGLSGNLTVVDVENVWENGGTLKQNLTLGKIIPDINLFLGTLGNRVSRLETNYQNAGFGTPLTSTQTETEDVVASGTWVWYTRGTAGVYRNSTYRLGSTDVYRGTWTAGSTATVTEA